MPTPRKSIIELAVTGTLGKNLGRYAGRIAAIPTIPDPVGRAPTHLTAQQKAAWAEIVRTAPAGVLTRKDRIAVEIMVHLLLKVRSPNVKTSEINAAMNILSRFGMDPVSRERMELALPRSHHEIAARDAEWAELDVFD